MSPKPDASGRLLVRHAAWVTVIAFGLHFVWENAQCSLFFIHGEGETTLLAMVRATVGDVALTWLAQISVAAVSRRWMWVRHRWRAHQWAALAGVALIASAAIEIYALSRGRWTYTPVNPRIPGLEISVVPILQLLLLFPLTFRLVAWRLRRAAGAEDETALTRRRYDRVAPIYDLMEWAMERGFRRWRRDLWGRVGPERVLEVGIGTGKSLPYHPEGAQVVGIDLSPRMLARAKRKAVALGSTARLEEADVQELPYADGSFDLAVSTCVFCSVPDPVRGLQELVRVLRPGGRLLMVEHVLSEGRLLRRLMRWIDWLPARIWGAHIDRETVSNVCAAGFEDVDASDLLLDVVKRIEARVPEVRSAVKGRQ